MRTIG
jgi:hypothetical protein